MLPVVLCLKELELIFDAITRVRGGELESLSGLSRCLVTEITRKDFRLSLPNIVTIHYSLDLLQSV